MSPVVRDAWMLRKLLEKATGIKVYKAELGSFSSFNLYRGIVQEYKDETNTHITVAQGSWSITEGGEYKVSLYTPTITIGYKRMINAQLVRNIANNIVDALKFENLGKTAGIHVMKSIVAGYLFPEFHFTCRFRILNNITN